jgi:hypothetical protein
MTSPAARSRSPLPPAERPARTIATGLSALALLALAACAQTGGSPAPREGSTDPRQAVVRGTTEGITIVPASRTSLAPGSTPATTSPSPPGSASGATPSGAPSPEAAASGPAARSGLAGLIQRLPPPTGRPLTEQKKLDAPDQGIPVPTAGSGGGR